MGYTRRRILIRSADRFQGTNTSFSIQLKVPIRNLRHSEWVSSSVNGLILFDKIPSTSMTANGIYYWRNAFSGLNGYYSPFTEDAYSPITFNTLQVSILNSNGTPSSTITPVEIELDLYCDDE